MDLKAKKEEVLKLFKQAQEETMRWTERVVQFRGQLTLLDELMAAEKHENCDCEICQPLS